MAGGPTGLQYSAYTWHSKDGGKTGVKSELTGTGAGNVVGLEFSADGSVGFATTINALENMCAVWRWEA